MAREQYEVGRLSSDLRMERMLMVLEPDSSQKAALEALLADQYDPQSAYYHQWLTPEEFGERFGVSESDASQVVNWLTAQGFDVEKVEPSRRLVVFSGTSAQVETAFHTEMRTYRVNGTLHHANATAPQIPDALSGVVNGVVSLHDFRRKPMHSLLSKAEVTPDYSSGSTHYLSPLDFSTIYDSTGLYTASVDGSGETIAVIGRTNILTSDVTSFRSLMGLAANSPTIVLNGTDPGIVSTDEQMEATLDVEWAGAVARKATVKLVVSATTDSTDGVDLSAAYAVNKSLAPVVTVSFGACEADMGTTENAFYNALWAQAAAEGISVMVASGDSGAAGCDSSSASTGSSGQGVNALCSPPYSTCVGGTQFQDTSNPSLYWGTTNTSYSSALSYIPEAVWNESASGGLLATGGGVSTIYTKPSWQTGTGVPADGYRDVPDVSLTSAQHDGYLVMMNGSLYVVAGTSAATPSFAGLVALAVEKTAAWQGNINPTLYALATKQTAGGAAVFHDITSGNNTVPGVTGFSAGTGYDRATGLGSVDAFVLVNHWTDASSSTPYYTLSESPATVSVVQGASATATITAAAFNSFSSAVALTASGLPTGVTATFSPTSIASGAGTSTLTLAAGSSVTAGTYSVTVNGSGDGVTGTAAFSLTVTAACTNTISPTSASVTAAGGTYTAQVTAGSGCAWTAASNASWISISGGGSGTGSGSTSYTVSANTIASARTGTMTIAGQTLTVTQAAAASAYTLSPTSATFTGSTGTGSITVTAPSTTSSWTVVSNNTWITVTSSAKRTGSGKVTYSVAANTTTSQRIGTLTVAGLTFTVTQAAPCTYSISPTSVSATASAASYSVQVTTTSACSWTAATSASWITISSGASATGSGTVVFATTTNSTTSTRSANMTIAGKTLPVSQASSTMFSLSPSSASYTASSGTGKVTVTASSSTATWTAASNSSWITLASSSSGTGSTSVSYSVAANTTSSARTGTMTIAGLTFTVTQSAVTCTYSVTPTTVSAAAAGGTYSVAVTAASGCSWTAAANVTYLSVSSGASGSGSGTVSFIAASNSGSARSGTLAIAGKTVSVSQAAATSGSAALSPAAASVTASASTGSVAVTTASSAASWTAVSNATWITVTSGSSATGSKTVKYSVAANTATSARTGTITIAGQTFVVTQAALSCNYTLGSMAVQSQTSGYLVTFPVTAATSCSWTAASDASWFTVGTGSGTGAGKATFTATANNTGVKRTANVTIAGYSLTVVQSK